MSTVVQYIMYLAILVILAIPLGNYISKVMNGEKTFLSKILVPCENAIYKWLRVDKEEQMNWKKYECFQLEKQAYRYESIWYQILKKVKK